MPRASKRQLKSKAMPKRPTPVEPSLKQMSWNDWSKLEFPTASHSVPAPAPTAASTSEVAEPRASYTATSGADTTPAAVVLTITALNKLIRKNLENEFPLIWVQGEISNFKAHPSGHFYFSLKDGGAQISAVMFRGYNSQLQYRPEDGMEVIVRGKVTVYEPRGNYQVFCETMEPIGAGSLQKSFEQLKRKLRAEGLFDESRKKPIPLVPKHIAVVTSPSGAAVRDILNVLKRRYRAAKITIVPCAVQGVRAVSEIVLAIELANRAPDVDVIIVGRGGGSIEDLWAFNEERVARAIAASQAPIISAVGHEIDFTIADFVADLRAPTPSAAAELVAQNADELLSRVRRLERNLINFHLGRMGQLAGRIRSAQRLLIDPRKMIAGAIQRCDELLEHLERAAYEAIDRSQLELELYTDRLRSRTVRRLDLLRGRFASQAAALNSMSPLKVLDRGYAIASLRGASEGGRLEVVTSIEQVHRGNLIEVRVLDGLIEAEVRKAKKGADSSSLSE